MLPLHMHGYLVICRLMSISCFIMNHLWNEFQFHVKCGHLNKERLRVYRTLFKNITKDWLYLVHFVGIQHWAQRMGITVAGGLQGWRHTAWWGRGWWSWSWRSVRLAHKQQQNLEVQQLVSMCNHIMARRVDFPFNFLGKHTHNL